MLKKDAYFLYFGQGKRSGCYKPITIEEIVLIDDASKALAILSAEIRNSRETSY